MNLDNQNRLILSDESWTLITEINDAINMSVTYKTDIVIYQKNDFWDIVESQGDCDDYALTKRSYLRQGGIPMHCMRLITCWVETGEYHAVLGIDTDRGTFILDNRYTDVQYFQDLPYKWHLREVPFKNYWEEIEN